MIFAVLGPIQMTGAVEIRDGLRLGSRGLDEPVAGNIFPEVVPAFQINVKGQQAEEDDEVAGQRKGVLGVTPAVAACCLGGMWGVGI